MSYQQGYPPQGGYPGGYPSGGYPPSGYPCADQGGYYGGARQYYFIKSRLNGLVLDIEGGSRNPGARVVMWNKKATDHDNQLWYEDPSTGTIRSKLNDLCLDVEGGTLVMKPFQPGDPNQQWMRADPAIRNRMMPNKCLDIASGKRDAGATLCSWDHHGGQNQSFDFEYDYSSGQGAPAGGCYPGQPTQSYPAAGGYCPGQPTQSYPAAGGYCPPAGASYAPRREFFIASELNGKVLDIERANNNPDAKVIMFHKKNPPAKNQLWYIDQQGVIRSALNDFAFQASGCGNNIKMHPFQGRHDQQWRFQDRRIVNPNGECLDIRGASQSDGADVLVYNYKGSSNQHWRQEFV